MYAYKWAMLNDLLTVIDAYAAATGLADATISTRVFGRGTRLGEIRAGGDIGARTSSRALAALSDCWPAGAAWPEGVARPQHGEDAA